MVLVALVTLSTLKCTVLLRGGHSLTVTVLPIWTSLKQETGACSCGASQRGVGEKREMEREIHTKDKKGIEDAVILED